MSEKEQKKETKTEKKTSGWKVTLKKIGLGVGLFASGVVATIATIAIKEKKSGEVDNADQL